MYGKYIYIHIFPVMTLVVCEIIFLHFCWRFENPHATIQLLTIHLQLSRSSQGKFWNWWFGARWFGIPPTNNPFHRGDPRNPNHRAPNHQFTIAWSNTPEKMMPKMTWAAHWSISISICWRRLKKLKDLPKREQIILKIPCLDLQIICCLNLEQIFGNKRTGVKKMLELPPPMSYF